jgi:hypothetical protein
MALEKRKTDKDDALKLAKLAALEQISTVHVPLAEQSLNAAYQAKAKGIGVTIQSVYNKLNGIESQIVEALLRHVVDRVRALMEQLGGTLPPLLEGYWVKILDGNAAWRCSVRSTVPLLATVSCRDLWIADRNFCTLGFLFGLHWRGAALVIRQHGW